MHMNLLLVIVVVVAISFIVVVIAVNIFFPRRKVQITWQMFRKANKHG